MTQDSICFTKSALDSTVDSSFSTERDDYWDKDDFGIGVCCLTALTADPNKIDPLRMVGSCVLSEDEQVLSFGYNHMPKKDGKFEFDKFKHDYGEEITSIKCMYIITSCAHILCTEIMLRLASPLIYNLLKHIQCFMVQLEYIQYTIIRYLLPY